MKKMAFLLVFAVIVTAITTLVAPEVKAQTETPILDPLGRSHADMVMPFTFSAGYSSLGFGFGMGLDFHQSRVPGLFLSGEFYQNAQLGFVIGCRPIALFTDKIKLVTGIEWQYQVVIITTHFHPTNQTFSGQDRMFLGLRFGPMLEIGKFGLGIYWNCGQTWVPSDDLSVQDWRWSQMFKVSLRMDL